MISKQAPVLPAWLDCGEYPFASHFFETPAGRMHYLDEGAGRPVVMVHGNPTWSFQYRNVIKALSKSRRCIAPDHLGFGLSEKPAGFSYLPVEHARHFELLLESLDLRDITLVVGDWGGPIGLSYALNHPDRVSSLVITNTTWLWSVRWSWYYQGFSGFMGGPIGRWLIRTRNYFVTGVMPVAYGDKKRLTPEIHRHYLKPLATPEDRKGSWVFPRQIIRSSDWLGSLWERRAALAGKRVTLAWGMKDIAFRQKELARWMSLFPEARVVRFPDCGHFVSEECGPELIEEIARISS
jgi:haloalkane dehalogenase